jgi:hypothetical protein
LGFVGSPWTLATYVIEGSSSGLYKTIKTMMHSNPDLLAALLSHLAEQIATYSVYQIDSGAQCIQLFDSWGGQLPPQVSTLDSFVFARQLCDANFASTMLQCRFCVHASGRLRNLPETLTCSGTTRVLVLLCADVGQMVWALH